MPLRELLNQAVASVLAGGMIPQKPHPAQRGPQP
jgi:hypothetical protein